MPLVQEIHQVMTSICIHYESWVIPKVLGARLRHVNVMACKMDHISSLIKRRYTQKAIRLKSRVMHIRSRVIVSSIIFLSVASTAWSRDGSLPNIDVQTLCRARQATINAVFGNQNADTFDSCVKSEHDARDKLLARWATMPTSEKANCVHPTAYSPSYLEWLGCIITREYAQTLPKVRPAAALAPGPCPHVTWKPDGTISSADTCHSR